MTYRERRERRAERLREWAEKREQRSTQAFTTAHTIADGIPFGQPILVGHHSEGRHRRDAERIENNMRRGIEDSRKAADMESRADTIEAQLDRSIYFDDEDAIDRLRERIADLEAQRDRIKAYNATCRKGAPDLSLLDAKQQGEIATILRVVPYQSKGGAFPAYALSGINGNIARNKKRIEEIEWREKRQQEAEDKGGVTVRGSNGYVNITFAEHPGRPMINALKAAGFGWRRGTWGGYAERLPIDCPPDVDADVWASIRQQLSR